MVRHPTDQILITETNLILNNYMMDLGTIITPVNKNTIAAFRALGEIMSAISHMNTGKKDQDHWHHLNQDHHTHHVKVDVIPLISHTLHIPISHIYLVIIQMYIITAEIAWTNPLQRIPMPVEQSLFLTISRMTLSHVMAIVTQIISHIILPILTVQVIQEIVVLFIHIRYMATRDMKLITRTTTARISSDTLIANGHLTVEEMQAEIYQDLKTFKIHLECQMAFLLT